MIPALFPTNLLFTNSLFSVGYCPYHEIAQEDEARGAGARNDIADQIKVYAQSIRHQEID